MGEIDKIKGYIDKYSAPRNPRYDMSTPEALAISHEMAGLEAVNLAFIYSRAKGYRAAKAEATTNRKG